MTTFIIITTTGFLTAEGSHWTRSTNGENVYVYPDSDAADPVAEVDADEFITIFDRDAGEYLLATTRDSATVQDSAGGDGDFNPEKPLRRGYRIPPRSDK